MPTPPPLEGQAKLHPDSTTRGNAMWKCKKCGEMIEDTFDRCWQCDTPDDGSSLRLKAAPNDAPHSSAPVATSHSHPKTVVLSHWYSLVPGFTTSTQNFYQALESELKVCQVPGLAISRVDFAEGGLISDKREYLRMTRERLVFDICAAPFGTSYFFSCRFAELSSKVSVVALGLIFVALVGGVFASFRYMGFGVSVVFWPLFLFVVVSFLRNAVSAGLNDFDAWLLRQELLGPIYQRFFRKETYYREDTRLMYLDTIDDVVKTKVKEITGANGIKLVRFNEHSPILRDLYKPTVVPLRPSPQPT